MCVKFVLNMRNRPKCKYPTFCFPYTSICYKLSRSLIFKSLCRQTALTEELTLLKQVDELSSNGDIPHIVNNGQSRYI